MPGWLGFALRAAQPWFDGISSRWDPLIWCHCHCLCIQGIHLPQPSPLQNLLAFQTFQISAQHHQITHHTIPVSGLGMDITVRQWTASCWGWSHLPSLDLFLMHLHGTVMQWYKIHLDCFLPSLLLHILLSAVPTICTPREVSQLDVSCMENWGKKEMAPDLNKIMPSVLQDLSLLSQLQRNFYFVGNKNNFWGDRGVFVCFLMLFCWDFCLVVFGFYLSSFQECQRC